MDKNKSKKTDNELANMFFSNILMANSGANTANQIEIQKSQRNKILDFNQLLTDAFDLVANPNLQEDVRFTTFHDYLNKIKNMYNSEIKLDYLLKPEADNSLIQFESQLNAIPHGKQYTKIVIDAFGKNKLNPNPVLQLQNRQQLTESKMLNELKGIKDEFKMIEGKKPPIFGSVVPSPKKIDSQQKTKNTQNENIPFGKIFA